MSPDQIFQLVNTIALLSWIILLLFPFKEWSKKLLLGIIISGFALLYGFLAFTHFSVDTFESFGELSQLAQLNADPMNVVIGWIHYLAFDLLAGLYITKNAEELGLNRYLLIPCQLFTFIMGPLGVLLYLILRFAYTKKWLHAV
ncbi:ABA4-like family protein [Jiulongibacter sediminis]|uniref:DUF4281 domain-containing protein n=1 Tax=Jiulongibacter sediminis TaxID=1605367 RepID=A0A0P7BX13_9BACT|nr:ABA4-like family protein [Jiulongibacter sediminis]KPM49149.1 hypothetical protein AFM12_00415 [Jiulongibacter sediminis]TBX26204.1 hypothetical protein TK44_00415 [Jiulongibacter sediminis]